MSNNPLSIIDLMEKEYDVSIEGDISAGKRCFNELFEIEGDNSINIEKIKTMKHLYELGDSNNRDELMYVENKIQKFIITEPHHISGCLDLYNFTQDFCTTGLSNELLPLLGKIVNLETDGGAGFGTITPAPSWRDLGHGVTEVLCNVQYPRQPISLNR